MDKENTGEAYFRRLESKAVTKTEQMREVWVVAMARCMSVWLGPWPWHGCRKVIRERGSALR